MDPQFDRDGKPYGPTRYKEIMRECWYISKHTHNSYQDVLLMSPTDRDMMISFISDDIKRHNQEMERILNKDKNEVK